MKEQIESIPVPIDREEWATLPRETPIYCTTLGQGHRFWFWEDMTPELIQAIDRDTGMKTAIGKAHNWTRRIERNQPAPLVSFEGEVYAVGGAPRIKGQGLQIGDYNTPFKLAPGQRVRVTVEGLE